MKHLKYLTGILIMALSLISFTSCSEDDEICVVSVISGFGGTATTSEVYVMSGSEVTLVATPKEGYRFVNWTVNGYIVSKNNPYTLTITASTQFKATFQRVISSEDEDMCEVSVISSEGGTATASETRVMSGSEVTLVATPKEGYRFVNWTVNGYIVSKNNPYTLTITASTQFKATFQRVISSEDEDMCEVSVISSEGGTATASESRVMSGSEVTLTASPKKGYHFVNWTVNGEKVSTKNPYTVTITSSTQFKANFKKEISTGVENGHNWVDLGLSVKWATCNVGATTPEGYGNYYAWGETKPKSTYGWSTYKYCNGDRYSMTKYCTNSEYGIVDNKTVLELSDDAAHVNWGGSWRMPKKAEQEELMDTDNCTWEWTTQNEVNGYKVTSKKNGNSIFLPAAGYRFDSNLYYAGSNGYYWSRSLDASSSSDACYLDFGSSVVGWSNGSRCYGLSVRAVCE